MKVTIKKTPEKKGLLGGRVFVLEMWLDLTKEEKDAIKDSEYGQMLLEVEADANDKLHLIGLRNFLKNSGPKIIPFADAFTAHSRGEEFKSNVETAAAHIKMYIAGDITGEESFEL